MNICYIFPKNNMSEKPSWLLSAILEALKELDCAVVSVANATARRACGAPVLVTDDVRTKLATAHDLLRLLLADKKLDKELAENVAGVMSTTRYRAILELACHLCDVEYCGPEFPKGEQLLTNDPVRFVFLAVSLALEAPWRKGKMTETEVVKVSGQHLLRCVTAREAHRILVWMVHKGLQRQQLSFSMQMKRGVYISRLLELLTTRSNGIDPECLCKDLASRSSLDVTLGTILALQGPVYFVKSPSIAMMVAVAIMIPFRTEFDLPDCMWMKGRCEAYVRDTLSHFMMARYVPMIMEMARQTRFAVACASITLPELEERFVADKLLWWLTEKEDQLVVAEAIQTGSWRQLQYMQSCLPALLPSWERWSQIRRVWIGSVVRAPQLRAAAPFVDDSYFKGQIGKKSKKAKAMSASKL